MHSPTQSSDLCFSLSWECRVQGGFSRKPNESIFQCPHPGPLYWWSRYLVKVKPHQAPPWWLKYLVISVTKKWLQGQMKSCFCLFPLEIKELRERNQYYRLHTHLFNNRLNIPLLSKCTHHESLKTFMIPLTKSLGDTCLLLLLLVRLL